MADNKSYGCANCRYCSIRIKVCSKGHDPSYKYGAHFLCDDFKLASESQFTANDMINSYFKKAGDR